MAAESMLDELYKNVSTLDLANIYWDPSDVSTMRQYKWDRFMSAIKDDVSLLGGESKQKLEQSLTIAKNTYDGEYMPIASYIKPEDFKKLVFGRLVILRQMSEIKKLEGDRGEIKKLILSKNDDDDDIGKLEMIDEYIVDLMEDREKIITFYKNKLTKYIPNEKMLRSLAQYIGVMFSQSDSQSQSQNSHFGCTPAEEINKRANRVVESLLPVINYCRN